jgi:type I restriction enzyme S subunit
MCTLITEHFERFGFSTLPLGSKLLTTEVILPGRFKRVYVDSQYGIPLIGGKEIGSLDPRTDKFLSLAEHEDRIIDQLTIKPDQILVTCSGTIGRTAIALDAWSGWAASQHIIRVTSKDRVTAGYLYAWLSTEFGRRFIRRFSYGAVVDEITDEQLMMVPVPVLEESVTLQIGELVQRAVDLRDSAFRKIEEATKDFEIEVLLQPRS